MSQTNHLIRRNGVWYYRRRVPEAHRTTLGKNEIQVSLGTTNLADAKRLRAVHDLKWSAQFEHDDNCKVKPHDPGSGSSPVGLLSESEALQRVRHFVEAEAKRSSRRLTEETFTLSERDNTVREVEVVTGFLKDRDDPGTQQWVSQVLDRIIPRNSIPGSAPETFLAEIVRRGLIELEQRKLGVLNDDHSRPFFDYLFDPSREPDVTFRQLADQLLVTINEDAAANDTNLKWVDKQKGFLDLLAEIVGEQTPAKKIDYDLCLKVRGVIATLPAGRTKTYSGLALERSALVCDSGGRWRTRAENGSVPRHAPACDHPAA